MPKKCDSKSSTIDSTPSPSRKKRVSVVEAMSEPQLAADGNMPRGSASGADSQPSPSERFVVTPSSVPQAAGDDFASPIFAGAADYHRGWSQVVIGATSGIMFTIIAFVGYCCYKLMAPYMAGISIGILLSIVLHPKSRSRSDQFHQKECERRMRVHNHQWRSTPAYYRWIGVILSLKYFVLFVLMQGVHFLGLQKLNVVGSKSRHIMSLEHTKPGRDLLRVVCMIVFCITGNLLVGFVPLLLLHVLLLLLFVVFVHVLSEGAFVHYFGRLWRISVVLFLVGAVGYNFCMDVIAISVTVQRTTYRVVDSTSSVVGNTNVTSMIVQEVQVRFLEEIARSFNTTNVTKTALDVKEAFGPLLANLTLQSPNNFTEIVYQLYEAFDSINGDQDAFEAVTTALNTLASKWRPLFDLLLSIVFMAVTKFVNIFDVIYELLLFVFVYRYLTTLPHTTVYYLVSKMLTPLHPQYGERHATNIEKDITISFRTLFQSFWHITWLHFSVTFCSFKFWGLPLPFFTGIIAVAMALFPLVPKWFSPCSIVFAFLVFDRIRSHTFSPSDWEALTFLVCLVLVVNDEWLLSVERGLRGARHHDSRGVVREQLPTFVIGTCVVLGLVTYGMAGVVLGPLTVIVARTLFDNWDLLSGWNPLLAQTPRPSASPTNSQEALSPQLMMDDDDDFKIDDDSDPRALALACSRGDLLMEEFEDFTTPETPLRDREVTAAAQLAKKKQ